MLRCNLGVPNCFMVVHYNWVNTRFAAPVIANLMSTVNTWIFKLHPIQITSTKSVLYILILKSSVVD